MAYTGLVEKYDYVRQTRNSNITATMKYNPEVGLDYNDRSTQVANTDFVQRHIDEVNNNMAYNDNQVVHKTGEMNEVINGIKSFTNDVNVGELTSNGQSQTFVPKVEIKSNQTTFHHNVVLNSAEGVFQGNLIGNAQTANWADLAEIYETDDIYPVGTLMQFGGKKELTAADFDANFVISEKPGVLLNGSAIGQPVALIGRVKVRVVGKVRKFDRLGLSNIFKGCATSNDREMSKCSLKMIALESSMYENEKLVECFVKADI